MKLVEYGLSIFLPLKISSYNPYSQVSLNGKVLPVGGIKEKIIAAQRSGITCVILPSANKRDFDDVPDFIRKELTVHFVDNYRDVYSVVFGESTKSEDQAKLRKVAS